MKIAIFGSGGLGAYYGARFVEAGHEVGFIARGEHLKAMLDKGLKIYSALGDVVIDKPFASDQPADIGPVDLVIVSVKTWQVPEVAKAMRPMINDDTLVVPFLNGVKAPDDLVDGIGAKHVLGGLSKIFSLIEAPGVIRHFNPSAYVEFGELDAGASDSRCADLKAAFIDAGVEASISDDIRRAMWQKLVMVSSWGGLAALTQGNMGDIRAHAETRELVTEAMRESLDVGRARGLTFDADIENQLWSFYDDLPGEATTSLSRDILAGRASELDAWHGDIVRYGEQAGVATPTHRFIYQALLMPERRARQT